MVFHGQGDEAFAPALVDSAGDHRIAMAVAVVSVVRTSGQSTISGWGSVATSYPTSPAFELLPTPGRFGSIRTDGVNRSNQAPIGNNQQLIHPGG